MVNTGSNQFVSYICPICKMTINNTSQKWEDRIMVESEHPNETQYAHKKCVDARPN